MGEAQRNGRSFSREMSDREAWARPSPREEAKSCLQIALSNGGIPSMRALIAVSDAERGELLQWAAESPALSDRIEAAIRFRAEVLRAFDELVSEERRAGELIAEGQKRGEIRGSNDGLSKVSTLATPKTLSDLGITRDQSSQWKQLAGIPCLEEQES